MATRRTAAFAALILAGACTDGARSTSIDASASGGDEIGPPFFGVDANQGITDATFSLVVPDAEPGVSFDATDLDAQAPDPVDASCDNDAADEGGLCPMPRSQCADGRWLVYFDNGACVSGQCSWEKRYVDCTILGCSRGACQSLGTK
jgi:hypothetical protein